VREIHDEISRGVYQAISGTTRGLAELVRGGLAGTTRPRPSPRPRPLPGAPEKLGLGVPEPAGELDPPRPRPRPGG